MQFLFNENSGNEVLKLRGEDYKYLFKVRRHEINDVLYFRNILESGILYTYKVHILDGRSATLNLVSSEEKEIKADKQLHIAWCVIDPKSVEKVLPSLNEIGVNKISFIYCERSQKNFKMDIQRYERILENSSQQCGRSKQIIFNVFKTLDGFLEEYPETVVLDFCDEVLGCENEVKTVLIGCEGGFSHNERVKIESLKRFRLDTPMILRSESAAMAIASKVLI
ncbi:16S rRNA (uracil(1498)-N(3))-methyltransferase [Sulfurimonas sp. MAG313]|nr:16S rRNA (uracil(1498)-N(3))-methyltransferase [Sulfurimonas sp. MAG313]MDF1882264.1 16S rRNA (uracil(1498)-N(3))-methyltransferase [Sulfurimonas sp. MAG313]